MLGGLDGPGAVGAGRRETPLQLLQMVASYGQGKPADKVEATIVLKAVRE